MLNRETYLAKCDKCGATFGKLERRYHDKMRCPIYMLTPLAPWEYYKLKHSRPPLTKRERFIKRFKVTDTQRLVTNGGSN